MKKIELKQLQYLNPVKQTCNHLLGKDHTQRHRLGAGVVFIVTGVLISKVSVGIEYFKLFFDGFGYLIHAFGTIPFIEALQQHLKDEKNENSDSTRQENHIQISVKEIHKSSVDAASLD
jgi:hypothetical protein